jgi:ABC-type histidine transport system ATPase subunit
VKTEGFVTSFDAHDDITLGHSGSLGTGFAREVADRMAFFHEGVVLEEGPPAQIFGSTRFAETRRFLDAVL